MHGAKSDGTPLVLVLCCSVFGQAKALSGEQSVTHCRISGLPDNLAGDGSD